MEDADFKRECRKAFLRYGASVPGTRRDCHLQDLPHKFHAGQETSSAQHDSPKQNN
jgi:hypothetical protein